MTLLAEHPLAPIKGVAVVDLKQSMILYVDGGARPNPGHAGWGIHGYLYKNTTPAKTIIENNNYITNFGYISKADRGNTPADKVKDVTPITFIDGYSALPEKVSNNVAEVVGMTNAFIIAAKYDIVSLRIYTDSEYAKNGSLVWINQWEKKGWLKSDGMPPSNVEHWKALAIAKKVLIDRGVKLDIFWIRGHADHLGNELADRLATLGVMSSQMGKIETDVSEEAAISYWTHVVEKHPFIANRRLYFNTSKEYIVPGEYYMGEHGKDDDLLGKRISDGAYSVVRLGTPEPMIELVRNHQSDTVSNSNSIAMILLDKLFNAKTHKEITDYGTAAINKKVSERFDLYCLNGEPVTRLLDPPMLAMRAVDSIESLSGKLNQFLANDPLLTRTDLTALLYNKETKLKKKVETQTLKLKPELNTGFAALNVVANYRNLVTNEINTTPLILTLNIDLLNRNALKQIEDLNPTVTLITWAESANVIRYATIVQVTDGVGIWAGYYSNMKVV